MYSMYFFKTFGILGPICMQLNGSYAFRCTGVSHFSETRLNEPYLTFLDDKKDADIYIVGLQL